MLKQLTEKTGLTDSEIKVLFFLVSLLSAGIIYKSLSETEQEKRVFNYQTEDSLFYAAEGKINGVSGYQNGEKKFDYKQEVLDFNTHNFNRVKPKKTALEKSINLNTAGLNDLVTIPGLGEKTALKILNYRTEKGSFKKLEELQDIKGIGIIKFNKIKNYVYIE